MNSSETCHEMTNDLEEVICKDDRIVNLIVFRGLDMHKVILVRGSL